MPRTCRSASILLSTPQPPASAGPAASPACSDCVAAASQPVSTGPIAWPIANTTVNTDTAEPHDAFGSDVLTRSVTAAGAVNIAPPKNTADISIAGREVLTSGNAAPMPR